MARTAIPLEEFDHEMATTRRLMERVPSDQAEWKPHEKSFALGHLTQLLSWMPGWITETLRQPRIDLARGPGYSFETTEALLETFDRNVSEARTALREETGAVLDEAWSLCAGDTTLLTMPREAAARNHVSHLVHHRGQLSVYLRLIGVPIPPIYGPTADESV